MSVYISAQLKRRIRTHFANCCAYCHTPEDLTVAIFEFEHIVPLSADGKTRFENLCLACPTCNRYKAFRQTGFDPFTNEMIKLFHPHLQVWSDHFAWADTCRSNDDFCSQNESSTIDPCAPDVGQNGEISTRILKLAP